MHVTTNSVNMTYAHYESPSSSVVRVSDRCMGGHGFDSRPDSDFSLSYTHDMFNTPSFLTVTSTCDMKVGLSIRGRSNNAGG